MIIKSIHIEKFRAFNDVSFSLGKRITAIAGRNATQKTTVLGMIGQPFSITQPAHPMFGSKTIDGYDFKSQFGEKFKFASTEQPGEHKWTLNLYDNVYTQEGVNKSYFTAESIKRAKGKLRIWNADDKAHSAGKGYVQIPVYYLSLSRLYPIGETVGKTRTMDSPTQEEIEYCIKHYREIMQVMEMPEGASIGIEEKTAKLKFAGISNANQEVSTNSAGEGNITRIMLAMLSFARLKQDFEAEYKGGILLIDELDAAVYPYAQKMLVDYLFKAANEFDVQVIFTTHSATILETLLTEQNKRQKGKRINPTGGAYDSVIVYLMPNVTSSAVRAVTASNICNLRDLRELVADMNLEYLKAETQVQAYCEDEMAASFATFLFGKYFAEYANYFSVKGLDLGWTEIVRLLEISAFNIDDSLILFDPDVPLISNSNQEQILNSRENVLYMPLLVEEGLFTLLRDPKNYNLFEEKISTIRTFSRDVCYAGYPHEVSYYKKQSGSTEIFKQWFSRAEEALGGRTVFYEFWYSLNKTLADNFIRDFCEKYNLLADKLKLDTLPLPAGLLDESEQV